MGVDTLGAASESGTVFKKPDHIRLIFRRYRNPANDLSVWSHLRIPDCGWFDPIVPNCRLRDLRQIKGRGVKSPIVMPLIAHLKEADMDSKRKTQTAGPDASDKAVHWRAEILFSSIIMKDGSPIGDDARTPPVAGGHMACAQLQRGQAAFALCALEFFRAKAARQYDIADMILDGAWANAARGRSADMSPDRPDPRTRLH